MGIFDDDKFKQDVLAAIAAQTAVLQGVAKGLGTPIYTPASAAGTAAAQVIAQAVPATIRVPLTIEEIVRGALEAQTPDLSLQRVDAVLPYTTIAGSTTLNYSLSISAFGNIIAVLGDIDVSGDYNNFSWYPANPIRAMNQVLISADGATVTGSSANPQGSGGNANLYGDMVFNLGNHKIIRKELTVELIPQSLNGYTPNTSVWFSFEYVTMTPSFYRSVLAPIFNAYGFPALAKGVAPQ